MLFSKGLQAFNRESFPKTEKKAQSVMGSTMRSRISPSRGDAGKSRERPMTNQPEAEKPATPGKETQPIDGA